MGNLGSQSSPFLVHKETRAVPGAHIEFHQLIEKKVQALAAKGFSYATYATVIGDANTTHHFASLPSLDQLGGPEVLTQALTDMYGVEDTQDCFDLYKDLIQEERFSVLRFENALSYPLDEGQDPQFLLLMTTRIRPGTQGRAAELMRQSTKAFQTHHQTAKFNTATTIVGDPNRIYRLASVSALNHIGGYDDLREVLSNSPSEESKAHFQAYREIVVEESSSLLRNFR
jgi:hypothetical protein